MILFVGGNRSGKSQLAEQWASRLSASGLYIASGVATDSEMAARIAMHRARRGSYWQCIEESLQPEESLKSWLAENGSFSGAILFDSISAWLANLLHAGYDEEKILLKAHKFFKFLKHLTNPVLLVSLECGCGIIPENELARNFIDVLGMVHQEAAKMCKMAAFVVCGLPIWLKGSDTTEMVGKERSLDHNSFAALQPVSVHVCNDHANLRACCRRSGHVHRRNRHRGGCR